MILTDAKGQPIKRPSRDEFKSDVDFVRAWHAYRDAVVAVANHAFDSAWKEGIL